MAKKIAKVVGDDVEIEWYGDTDIRSYNVSFNKIKDLGFKVNYRAEDGCLEILEKLQSGNLDKTVKTITLDWYLQLTEWHKRIKDLEFNNSMIDI